MVDELDREALQFLESKQMRDDFRTSNKLHQITSNVNYGGKRTLISDKKRQSREAAYISDEPERFEQYIDDLKDKFITEEQAKELIEKKWKNDPSLSNLLEGLKERGVFDRELNALLNTPNVQKWFQYENIAKRLKMSTKSFKKSSASIDIEKLKQIKKQIEQKPRKVIKAKDLFFEMRRGTVKGQEVQGNRSVVKIYSKNVVRYRDNKGRFIKVI
jgi:hypothetical protein